MKINIKNQLLVPFYLVDSGGFEPPCDQLPFLHGISMRGYESKTNCECIGFEPMSPTGVGVLVP